MKSIDDALEALSTIPHVHGGKTVADAPCAGCVAERAVAAIRTSVDELTASLSQQSLERARYLSSVERHQTSLEGLRDVVAAKLSEITEEAERMISQARGPSGL